MTLQKFNRDKFLPWPHSSPPRSPLKSSYIYVCVCVCVYVCYFVLLNRYWGIVTVLGSIPCDSRPGVTGSSPFTLTTSLVIPAPSSSSSNGPRNYSVDNHGLVPWRLRRLGRSKVRSASLVRVLSSSQNSFWDGYGSFDKQRLFSVEFVCFRNFFDFAQIWGILESDKLNADRSQMGRTNLDKSVW